MSIQNFNTFSAAAAGFKFLPASLAMQTITVTAGVLSGYYTWNTIRETYFPGEDSARCKPLQQLDLKQKMLAVLAPLPFLVLSIPAGEEILFRGFIQDGLLTKGPKMFLNLCGKGHWANAIIPKMVRSAITAGLFSAYHLQNLVMGISWDQMYFQLANTLGLGLVCSAVKERTGSIWPAVGLHALFNAIFIQIPIASCILSGGSSKTDSSYPPNPTTRPEVEQGNETCKLPEISDTFKCSAENQPLIEKAKDNEWSVQYHRAEAEDYAAKAETLKEQAQSSLPVSMD